jgi:pimeloyl-ACP methyl ester carboxylesterase
MRQVERPTQMIELAAGPVEYRLERRNPPTVLVLPGGHMRAGLALGEEVFADAGYTIVVPSRPGYGRTPLATGTSPDGFADAAAELCHRLGIEGLAAVVGQSASGPTAVAMAARHPHLVERLILQSAIGPLPWPDRRTRLASGLVFRPRTEPVTWALIHTLMRRAPTAGLRLLLRDLTSKPIGPFLAALQDRHRTLLLELFTRMRSGSGFHNDLHFMSQTMIGSHAGGRDDTSDRRAAQVTQPTLIIATRNDTAVPFAHAQTLAQAIPHARLITSHADSHFIWFGDDYPTIAATITGFLTDQPHHPRSESI